MNTTTTRSNDTDDMSKTEKKKKKKNKKKKNKRNKNPPYIEFWDFETDSIQVPAWKKRRSPDAGVQNHTKLTSLEILQQVLEEMKQEKTAKLSAAVDGTGIFSPNFCA